MTERDFEVRQILDINSAVNAIADNKYLDGTTAFRVGRLGDFTKSIVRRFNKERDRLTREAREREKTLQEKHKNGSIEEKIAANEEIKEVADKLQDDLNTIAENIEKIKVPELKLSSFIAKHDITELVVKDGVSDFKVVVKTGQTLVPVGFFALMGDIIIDDKESSTEK